MGKSYSVSQFLLRIFGGKVKFMIIALVQDRLLQVQRQIISHLSTIESCEKRTFESYMNLKKLTEEEYLKMNKEQIEFHEKELEICDGKKTLLMHLINDICKIDTN